MPARSLLIASILVSTSAFAAPTIDPQFGDHAVIQRNAPIRISGTAAPGERLRITFAGDSASSAADASGRWQATLPSHAAGGPFELAVTGSDGSASAEDLLVGDVWLCSGQSNMEFPVSRALAGASEAAKAADPQLRLFQVEHQLAPAPKRVFETPPSWAAASPDSVSGFSAACYFMVRQLREDEQIPIGAIDDSWGGTPIRAWMSEAAVRSSGGGEAVNVTELHRRDPSAALRKFGEVWGAWWRSRTGDEPGQEPWNASDRLSWKPVPSLGYWDEWGPQWKSFDGSIWARRKITLTAKQAAQPATLSLSAIDDMDETFVNGVAVGGANDPSNPRSYAIPKGLLHAGANDIIVFARDVWGQGGFKGPPEMFKLTFADGDAKPLSSGWQYSRIPDSVGQPPVPPWAGYGGVSTIYNAMVAPLGDLPITGVAWYQGATDVGTPGYDKRLAAFMADWRRQFGRPDLPFLIVGLAGFGTPVAEPKDSGWATLIDEQRLAAERDARAQLVSAIDLGEWKDIHPANKQEVGRRLALAARAFVYRDGGSVGPAPVRVAKGNNRLFVVFTKPLQVLSGASPLGFELCGAEPGTCRFADARVNGAKVEIPLDAKPVTRVRYAWADFPIVNLYDKDLLPVPVFELPVGAVLDQ